VCRDVCGACACEFVCECMCACKCAGWPTVSTGINFFLKAHLSCGECILGLNGRRLVACQSLFKGLYYVVRLPLAHADGGIVARSRAHAREYTYPFFICSRFTRTNKKTITRARARAHTHTHTHTHTHMHCTYTYTYTSAASVCAPRRRPTHLHFLAKGKARMVHVASSSCDRSRGTHDRRAQRVPRA